MIYLCYVSDKCKKSLYSSAKHFSNFFFLKRLFLKIFVVTFFFSSYISSATIQAIAAYLDAFQKIADAATNSRGKCKSNFHLRNKTNNLNFPIRQFRLIKSNGEF